MGRRPARCGPDRLGRGGLPRGDGEIQRGAAGAVPQADKARAGEGEEEDHDGHTAKMTC